MKEGLETVCSHGQGKPFPCDLISLSISQQTHFSWLVMPSDNTCLSYNKVWISEIEMMEGGRHQNSVGVKNCDISAGQELLRSPQTFHPRVCLTIQGSSILRSIIPPTRNSLSLRRVFPISGKSLGLSSSRAKG